MRVDQQITKIAVDHFKTVLMHSASDDGTFKTLSTVSIDGECKPLLMFGSANSRVEDGNIYAVLNPDQDLIGKLKAGCSYSTAILNEIVRKRCDFAVHVWVDAYKKDGITVTRVYKNRAPSAAKILIQ